MKRISLVSLLALSFTLISIALIVSAGGPVTGKTGIYDPAPGIGKTEIAVANMHPSASAYVQVSKFFMDGKGAASPITTTLGTAGRSITVGTEDAPYSDWHGTLAIESDRPLATITQINWNQGGYGDGMTAGAYSGSSSTATELFFPYVVYQPNIQFTRLVLTNVGSSDTALRFQYFDDAGVAVPEIITDTLVGYPTSVTGWSNPPVTDTHRLLPGHTRIYDMHIPGTQVPYLASSPVITIGTTTAPYWGGSLKVTSLDGQGLVGVATNHWSATAANNWVNKGALAYSPLITGTHRSFVPSVERRKSSISGDPMLGYSVMRIQCISADSDDDCDVSVNLVPSANSPSTETLSLTCEIPQNATKAVNTKQSQPSCGGTMLTSDTWVGSATIWTTDISKIGVVSMSIREQAEMALGYSGLDENNASTTVYAPSVYITKTSGTTLTQWSIISIQNITTTTQSADVSLHFLGRQLSENTYLDDLDIEDIVVQPGEVFRLNTKQEWTNDDYDIDVHLGDQWEGSLRVESDIPVAVLVETLYIVVNDRWMSAYNGIPYP